MTEKLDIPNLLYFMDEIIKLTQHFEESVTVQWAQDSFTFWHYSDAYDTKARYRRFYLGQTIDAAYDRLEEIQNLVNKGELLDDKFVWN